MPLHRIIETDVLIIGGGMAGMFSAIKASEQGVNVVLADKAYVSKSGSTNYSGGYYLVFNPEWGHNLDDWMDQVSFVGEYLNDRTWTEIVLKDSYARYKDLVSWGVEFVKKDGKLARTLNPPTIESLNMWRRKFTPMIRRKVTESGVKIFDRVMVVDLIKKNDRVVGAVGFHTRTGASFIFKAKATVIAAGAGSFKQAGLPTHYWTSDGESIAFRAGAVITGKEFEMKGFTMADYPAWRGHGMAAMAKLKKYVNAEGKSLGREDIIGEVHKGRGPIYWDVDDATPEEIDSVLHHMEMTGTTLEAERVGLDVTQGGKYPIVGGVWDGASINGGAGGVWPADTDCSSGIAGLYAAGESLASRQIGTIYPAMGLGLCGAAVTGTRAGIAASKYSCHANEIEIKSAEQDELKKHIYYPISRKGGFSPSWVTQMLKNTLIPYYVWQVKHKERMRAALTMIEFLDGHIVPKMKADDSHELRLAIETRNMVQNARLMLEASIFRTESRGSHYREDFPCRIDQEWLAWVKLKKEGEKVKVWKESIPEAWRPDVAKPYEDRYPVRFPHEMDFLGKEVK